LPNWCEIRSLADPGRPKRCTIQRKGMANFKQRVIQLSAGRPENLSKRQNAFLDALCQRLRADGLETAKDSAPGDGIAARYDRLRGVDGVIVVAFSQWSARRLNRDQERERILPSEFVHIYNTMAVAAGKPLLVMVERDVEMRGTLRDGYVPRPTKMPRTLRPDWLETDEFQADFSRWLEDVNRNKHVFLGYASEAESVANSISLYLNGLGVDVLDWHQFRTSGFILQRIEEAARCTACGIFLFTSSDQLKRTSGPHKVPRDNVIFELGYFAGQKGKERTLVVVEEGTEIPTDLGGYLHVPLPKSRDTNSIESRLNNFLRDNIGSR